MMVVRALTDVTPVATTANLTFNLTANNSRIWAPNAAAQTYLANSGDPLSLVTLTTITSFTNNNNNVGAAFITASTPHFYFDDDNNLRLDRSWGPLNAFLTPSVIVVNAGGATQVDADNGGYRIYPADRCTWRQDPGENNQGYIVHSAQFFGLGTTATVLHDAQLGYIGKSGRFVEIAK